MDIQTAGQELIALSKRLLAQGIAHDWDGCLSARVQNLLVITPEDIPLSRLTPEDLSLVELNTATHTRGPRPDRRFALHLAVYGKRKKFNALIHAQSLSVVTASKKGLTVPPLLDDMAQLVGVSAKVARHWPHRGPGPVISAMNGRNAVLLRNKGGLCGAGTFEDAHAVAQVLEKGCKAFIESTFLGGGVRINRVEAALMRLVYRLAYSGQHLKNR
ncbi:MAG: class II aldolase/adducin family protein [Desulfobacterium sp.]|nr:class II aldolase/adducin family protein [Desulfobacterium sp.]